MRSRPSASSTSWRARRRLRSRVARSGKLGTFRHMRCATCLACATVSICGLSTIPRCARIHASSREFWPSFFRARSLARPRMICVHIPADAAFSHPISTHVHQSGNHRAQQNDPRRSIANVRLAPSLAFPLAEKQSTGDPQSRRRNARPESLLLRL